MNPFQYMRATDAKDAIGRASLEGAKFLGGGTNLVDLMRETVERPSALVDVSGLSASIEEHASGVRIGAAAKNTAVAEHALIRQRYPLLTRAILAGASGQIRNMATVGGNLLQRTRCTYFYDAEGARCNKRAPGSGCDALEGANRYHAILGASTRCVATHPSDMCVALAALDATIELSGVDGDRAMAMTDFHTLPEDDPSRETRLRPGELITAVQLPAHLQGARVAYRKVRDRASYAFALISVAVMVELEGETMKTVRVAFGGVAHKPWRARQAEAVMQGSRASEALFRAAAEEELKDAQPLRENGFKIELVKRTLVHVMAELTGEVA